MPLQTVFRDKVTAAGTTQLYPLDTIRIEGKKAYKYVKNVGASLANKAAVTYSAQGTVKLRVTSLTSVGVNWTGAAIADGSFFWMQVAGEVGPVDTSGATAVGYPLYAVDATGLVTGLVTNATAIGASVVSVDHATGYGVLCGLL